MLVEWSYYVRVIDVLHQAQNQYLPTSYTKTKNSISFKHVMFHSKHCFLKENNVHYENKQNTLPW